MGPSQWLAGCKVFGQIVSRGWLLLRHYSALNKAAEQNLPLLLHKRCLISWMKLWLTVHMSCPESMLVS